MCENEKEQSKDQIKIIRSSRRRLKGAPRSQSGRYRQANGDEVALTGMHIVVSAIATTALAAGSDQNISIRNPNSTCLN